MALSLSRVCALGWPKLLSAPTEMMASSASPLPTSAYHMTFSNWLADTTGPE
jgi:hypothetical protein